MAKKTIHYELSSIKNEDRIFFFEMLSYISPHIEESKLIDNNNAVNITCAEEYEQDVLVNVNKLFEMIASGHFSNKDVKTKVLVDNTSVKSLQQEPIFEKLIERGDIKQISDGVYAYSKVFLKIFQYFNNKIEDFGFKNFSNIQQYEFPVIYPISGYEKGGYFESFPHHIMFQTLMNNDINVLEKFAEYGASNEEIFNEMRKPKNVLRHAACVPIYEYIENQIIDKDDKKTFLVSGKCFRNEANNIFELARLNEFFMKEYVFMGTPTFCAKGMSKAHEIWEFWANTFNLNCKIETANDSFFANSYKKLKLFQVLGASKQEFKIQLPASNMYVACSSANQHRTHFSKPYNIKLDENTYAYTSCFAFGIDRLTYALLSQKGINPDKWDTNTITEIEKYVKI